MNPHEYEVLRRFADAMTACHNPAVGCDCCPHGSKTDCYFDDEDRTREALDILNRLLDMPFLTADHREAAQAEAAAAASASAEGAAV